MKKQADQPFFIPKMGVFKNGPWGGHKKYFKIIFFAIIFNVMPNGNF